MRKYGFRRSLWWKPFQHLLQSTEAAQWQSQRKLQFSVSLVSTTTSFFPVFLRSSSAKTRSKMSRLMIMHLFEHAPTPKSELIYLLKESISPWQKIVRWPDARHSNCWHLTGPCVFVFTTDGFDLEAVCVCIYRIGSHGNCTYPLFLQPILLAATRGEAISTVGATDGAFCWMNAVSGAWTRLFTHWKVADSV